MTAQEILDRLDANEKFRKLLFSQQLELRRQALSNLYMNDPRFRNLSINEQKDVINKIALSRKPAFENPYFGKYYNPKNPGQGVLGMGIIAMPNKLKRWFTNQNPTLEEEEAYIASNPAALRGASFMNAYNRAMKSGFATPLVDKAMRALLVPSNAKLDQMPENQRRAFYTTDLSRPDTQRDVGRWATYLAEKYGTTGWQTAGDIVGTAAGFYVQAQLAKGATKGAVGFLKAGPMRNRTAIQGLLKVDRHKAGKILRRLGELPERPTEIVSKWLLDASMGQKTGAFANAMKALGRSQAGTIVAKHIIPGLVTATGSGIIGIREEAAMSALGLGGERHNYFANGPIEGTIKAFGDYALWDYALNTLGGVYRGVLKPLIAPFGWKAVFKGASKGGIKMTGPELVEHIANFKKGTMAKEVFAGLPIEVQDHLTALKNYDDFIEQGVDVWSSDPLKRATVTGFYNAVDVVDAGGGKIRMRHFPSKDLYDEVLDGKLIGEFDSIVAANKHMADLNMLQEGMLERKIVSLEKEIASLEPHTEQWNSVLMALEGKKITLKDMKYASGWLKTYVEMPELINGIYGKKSPIPDAIQLAAKGNIEVPEGWTVREIPRSKLYELAEQAGAVPKRTIKGKDGKLKDISAGAVNAFTDHAAKVIYVPKEALPNTRVELTLHERAHVKIAQGGMEEEDLGASVLDSVRRALENKTPANAIEETWGILPETVEHMKPYMHSNMNEASLIEEAFAAEVGAQDFRALGLKNPKMYADVAEKKGILPMHQRAAITYGEMDEIAARKDVNTFKFFMEVDPNVTSFEKRLIGEKVRIFQKTHFIENPAPYKAVPRGTDVNGILVYKNAAVAKDVAGARALAEDMIQRGYAGNIEDLTHAVLLESGYDAIKNADGSMIALLPETQIKHVSEFVNPKTGQYTKGADLTAWKRLKVSEDVKEAVMSVGETGAVEASYEVATPSEIGSSSVEEAKLDPRFVNDLGKNMFIRQKFALTVGRKAVKANDNALVALIGSIYGDVDPAKVQLVAEAILERANLPYGKIVITKRPHIARPLPPRTLVPGGGWVAKAKNTKPRTFPSLTDVVLTETKGEIHLSVPENIVTLREQQEFVQNLGDVLVEKLRKEHTAWGREHFDKMMGGYWSIVETTNKQLDAELQAIANKYRGKNKGLRKMLSEKAEKKYMQYLSSETAKMRDIPRQRAKWTERIEKQAKYDIPGARQLNPKLRRQSMFKFPHPEEATEKQILTYLDEYLVNRNLGKVTQYSDGNIDVLINGKGVFRSKNAYDAFDTFMVQSTTPAALRTQLNSYGYNMIKEGELYKVFDPRSPAVGKDLKKRGLLIGQGKDVPDLLADMQWKPDRISAEFAPESIVVTNAGSVKVTMKAKYAFGGMDQMTRFVDQFVDLRGRELAEVIARNELGSMARTVHGTFEVSIPELGVTRTFTEANEAAAFLKGNVYEWKNFSQIAKQKGFELGRDGSQWVLVDQTGRYHADTLQELGNYLAKRPDPAGAKNLIEEISEADIQQAKLKLSSQIAQMPQFWMAPSPEDLIMKAAKKGKKDVDFKIPVTAKISQAWKPEHDWIVDALRKTPHHRLAEIMNSLDEVSREMNRQRNTGRALLLDILSEETGRKGRKKLFSKEVRQGIFYYMQEPDPVLKKQVAMDLGLEQKHIDAANKLKEIFLGSSPTEGLYKKFGMDPNKWLFSYMSRIKEWSMQNPGLVNELITMHGDDWMKVVFSGDTLPKEVRFWAQHARSADLVDWAKETDVLRVMLRYNDAGHKNFFLNPYWKEIDTYMKSAQELSPTLTNRINRYRAQIMGFYETDFEKSVREFGAHLFEKMGKNAEVGKDLMSWLYTTNVLASQAYRPWLTIRNMTQIWTTLAPLIGNTYTHEAAEQVMKNPDEIIKRLQTMGIITEAPPLLNELMEGESLVGRALGKATRKGMVWFKNSDDITRAIAYRAGEIRFDEGVTKLKNGVLKNSDQWERYTANNLLHDEVAAQVKALVERGDPDSIARARYLFANDVQEITMFSYRKEHTPTAYHGFLGKLFGQYGIYAPNYLALVKRLFTKGTGWQKIAQLTRLGGNAMAIYYALNAMGIDSKNFLPWTPATMTGGPLFNLGINALYATGNDYRARQARGELSSYMPVKVDLAGWLKGEGLHAQLQVPRNVPGYYEYKAISNAVKYIDQGDYWLSFLALTTAPIRQDLR